MHKTVVTLHNTLKMDPNSIPQHIRRLLQDKNMNYSQKMVAFFAFMPNLPQSGNEAGLQQNIEIGKQIKKLVDEGKIALRVDKNFNVSAIENKITTEA